MTNSILCSDWIKMKYQKHFPKQNLHQKKVLANVCWFVNDIIYHSNPDKNIIAEKHCQEIKKMQIKNSNIYE